MPDNRKKNQRLGGGVNRLVGLLAVLAVLFFIGVIRPALARRAERAELLACSVSMKKAQDMLTVEYLNDPDFSEEDARAVLERSKMAMENLCPAGGDYYLIPQRGGQFWNLSCGVHEQDTRLRTRLNATRVFELLNAELDEYFATGKKLGGGLFTFTINGEDLYVQRINGNNGLRRGTDSSIDFEGIICLYSYSDDLGLRWFVYADRGHAAVWKAEEGWSGDAYTG